MTAPNRKHRAGGLRLPPAPERLAASLVPTPSGCLVRVRSITKAGYSVMTMGGKKYLAHRLAWQFANGRPVPEGLCVMHSCDNPPCCNPAHLSVGTLGDNNRDMWSKGRGVPAARRPWVKIPLEELPSILERYANGERKGSIAETYGVSRQAIHYLLRREGAA